jgi:hypothetical protein
MNFKFDFLIDTYAQYAANGPVNYYATADPSLPPQVSLPQPQQAQQQQQQQPPLTVFTSPWMMYAATPPPQYMNGAAAAAAAQAAYPGPAAPANVFSNGKPSKPLTPVPSVNSMATPPATASANSATVVVTSSGAQAINSTTTPSASTDNSTASSNPTNNLSSLSTSSVVASSLSPSMNNAPVNANPQQPYIPALINPIEQFVSSENPLKIFSIRQRKVLDQIKVLKCSNC